ncbi:hypothetical protein HDU98_000402 [Podochytrium sp. JEL0797]|nr:hypothetical protein HDU98_000402 [Podochytrium sp. JEL0797]
MQELVGSTAPVVRWERSWLPARSFPAPPAHAIGNTPGTKIASVKAQFFKWKTVPDKDPVDFSDDDLYIIEVPDEEDAEAQAEGGSGMDVDEKDDEPAAAEKDAAENSAEGEKKEDAMDTSGDAEQNTDELHKALKASMAEQSSRFVSPQHFRMTFQASTLAVEPVILYSGIMTLQNAVHPVRVSKYQTLLIRANSVESIAFASCSILGCYEKLYLTPESSPKDLNSQQSPKQKASLFLNPATSAQRSTSASSKSRRSSSHSNAVHLHAHPAEIQEYDRMLRETSRIREVEALGQLSYAATRGIVIVFIRRTQVRSCLTLSSLHVSGHSVLAFIPIRPPPLIDNPYQIPPHELILEEPWYIQMDKVLRIFDETEINMACHLSFLVQRQEFKFACESSAAYGSWIAILDDSFDECHPNEGLSKHYDLMGKRSSYQDSESSVYSSLPSSTTREGNSRSRGSSSISNPSKSRELGALSTGSRTPEYFSGGGSSSVDSKKSRGGKKKRKNAFSDGGMTQLQLAESVPVMSAPAAAAAPRTQKPQRSFSTPLLPVQSPPPQKQPSLVLSYATLSRNPVTIPMERSKSVRVVSPTKLAESSSSIPPSSPPQSPLTSVATLTPTPVKRPISVTSLFGSIQRSLSSKSKRRSLLELEKRDKDTTTAQSSLKSNPNASHVVLNSAAAVQLEDDRAGVVSVEAKDQRSLTQGGEMERGRKAGLGVKEYGDAGKKMVLPELVMRDVSVKPAFQQPPLESLVSPDWGSNFFAGQNAGWMNEIVVVGGPSVVVVAKEVSEVVVEKQHVRVELNPIQEVSPVTEMVETGGSAGVVVESLVPVVQSGTNPTESQVITRPATSTSSVVKSKELSLEHVVLTSSVAPPNPAAPTTSASTYASSNPFLQPSQPLESNLSTLTTTMSTTTTSTAVREIHTADFASIYAPPRSKGVKKASSYASLLRQTSEIVFCIQSTTTAPPQGNELAVMADDEFIPKSGSVHVTSAYAGYFPEGVGARSRVEGCDPTID